jgi:drug/metabolite transporter (DMT)-like permease
MGAMPRLALLLTTLIWGATFPATKAALEQLPPFSFLFIRFLIGLGLGLLFVLAWRRRLYTDRQTIQLSAIAALLMFLGYAFQTIGLRYTSASNSAFITALYVVLVPLFLRRFEPRTWISACLAVIGLWLLINPPLELNASHPLAWIRLINPGDLWTLACAAAFAGHIACLESYTRRSDGQSLFVWQLVFMTVALGPMMWLEVTLEASKAASGLPALPFSSSSLTSPSVIIALLVCGLLATVAFAVQIWAQRLLPAHRVALIFSLEPAFAAWLAWYFLGEHLDLLAWLGSALILSAVIFGAMRQGERPVPSREVATGVCDATNKVRNAMNKER